MSKLYVKIKSVCTHSEGPDEAYGPWESSHINTFKYVTRDCNRDDFLESVPIDFEYNNRDEVYVIWAEYSTGDSFGMASCGSTEVVHIFKNYDLALKAVEALKTKNCGLPVEFESDSGKVITYCRPWIGYFESLDEIHLETAYVRSH